MEHSGIFILQKDDLQSDAAEDCWKRSNHVAIDPVGLDNAFSGLPAGAPIFMDAAVLPAGKIWNPAWTRLNLSICRSSGRK